MKSTATEEKKAKKAAYMRKYMREYTKRKRLKAKLKAKESTIFVGPDKDLIRNTILESMRKTGDGLDLLGNGQMFEKVKKEAKNVNITSIDTGEGFNNNTYIKKMTKKYPGQVQQISFADYANNATEAEQKGTIWLDVCGAFSDKMITNLEVAPKAMKKKGNIFITLMHGREQFMVKETSRRVTNKVIINTIKEVLREGGVKTNLIFKHDYKSSADYKGKNKWKTFQMTTYGLKYTKNEAYIKAKAKREAQAQLKAIKAKYTKKEIDNMVKALQLAGYSINASQG
jgi:hypothetical protein